MGGFCAKKQQLRYCQTNIGLYSQFWRIGVGLKGLYGCWYLIIIAINTKRSFSILLTIISIGVMDIFNAVLSTMFSNGHF